MKTPNNIFDNNKIFDNNEISDDEILLQDCPLCGGPGCLEEEGGWCVYVQCLDCGCHTAELSFRDAAERKEMANRVALSWNLGKVIYPGPGD